MVFLGGCVDGSGTECENAQEDVYKSRFSHLLCMCGLEKD